MMTQITIPGQIVNGHLQHEKNLAKLEGQHMIAALTVVPTESANRKQHMEPPEKAADNSEFDPEPPPWLEVEHDVYFLMTRPAKRLGKVRIRVQRGKPCIVMPEQLPND
jgi:hypothetical protein